MEIKLDKKPETAAKEERERILTLILKNSGPMGANYRELLKHTGGLLTNSMVYAYAKGIQDVIKLILKGEPNEKSVQTEKEPSPADAAGAANPSSGAKV